MAPVIRAASLRGFAPLVRELGGDPERYLRRFDISTTTLSSDDGLVPITEHDLMLDAVADELGCADLGLRLAESQDLTILGPLALAIESSSTVPRRSSAPHGSCSCTVLLSASASSRTRGTRAVSSA